MARKEVNFCAEMVEDPYCIFNFGEDIKFFEENVDYGVLMVAGGVFPSVSQAWKHGYRGSIPTGYSDFKINGCDVYIYNPDREWAERMNIVQSGYPDYATDENGRTIRIYDGNPEMYGPYIDNGGR